MQELHLSMEEENVEGHSIPIAISRLTGLRHLPRRWGQPTQDYDVSLDYRLFFP